MALCECGLDAEVTRGACCEIGDERRPISKDEGKAEVSEKDMNEGMRGVLIVLV